MEKVDLLGVQSELENVVTQSKERSQWEGADEDGDEAVLDDHLEVLVEESLVTPLRQLEVLHVLRCPLRRVLALHQRYSLTSVIVWRTLHKDSSRGF